MGFVYFGTGRDAGRAVMAATTDVAEQLNRHKRVDRDFEIYRSLETPYHLAGERYLHELYACRRLMAPQNEPWFAIELDEVDHALRLWDRKTKSYREGLRKVQHLKTIESSQRLLTATPDDLVLCERLRDLNQQIDTLNFEKECLEIELKLRIGREAGIRNLVTWETKASFRFSVSDLREMYPKLYEKFRKRTASRYFRTL